MVSARLALACLAFFAVGMPAQQQPGPASPSTSPRQAPQKAAYTAEPTITERFDTTYTFHADGTGSKLDTAVIHVQSEAAVRSLSVLTIPYSTRSRSVEFVYARVRKGNGSTIDTPVSEAQDHSTPAAQADPLYSDTHLAQLPVHGLAAGDRLEYQVRTLTTKPEVAGQFFGVESFGHGRVILERSVELRVPVSRYLQVICPQNPAQVSEVSGDRIYRWTGAQTRPTMLEGGNAAADEVPDEVAPPIAWTTFHTWAEVGAWFRDLTAPDTAPAPEITRKLGELTFGLPTPRERLDAIYNFVSQQIRSITVPLGQAPWQPHSAIEVLSNQFGDSEDKAVLLVSLLRTAQVPASLALLPTGRPVEEAVPAPLWFTEAAVVAGAPGTSELWLDTLPEVAAPGVLDTTLRDKLALVIPVSGESTLRRTPAELPFAASTHFDISGTLTGSGALAAHVDLVTQGDNALHMRQSLRNLGQTQTDRLGRAVVQAFGLPGEPGNVTLDAPEQLAAPLHMAFDLTTPHYSNWENFRIVPLEPVLNLPFADRKSAPGHDLELGGKRTDSAAARLSLPPGFSADLPADTHVHTDFADLDTTNRLETPAGGGATLVSERTLTLKQGRLAASRWADYRQFLDQASAETPWIQITSVTSGTAHHPPAPGENNPKAAALVQAATEAIDRQDWATATARLDQARELNGRQPLLWSSYSAVARGQGHLDEALANDRREWQAHPEEAAVSHRFASELTAKDNKAEAVSVLQATLALNPRDERTAVQLSQLQAPTDPPAAGKTLRDSLTLAPDSLPLKLALGALLVQEGKRDEGAALLSVVASESQDTAELNDSAFFLGNAGVNLPLAEQASRRSIQLLNAASERGEDRGHLQAALQRTAQFLASWDTYGFVLLRQGLTTEAEPWLRAAWADGGGPASARHLAQLLQKQGRGTEANAVLREDAAQGNQGVASKQKAHTFLVPKPAGTPIGAADFAVETALNMSQGVRFLEGNTVLATLETAVARVDLHTLFPPGTPAHLVRVGKLQCEAGATCTLQLLPVQAAPVE